MSRVVGVDVGKKKFSKRYVSIHILISLPGLMRDLITRVTFRFLCKSFIIFTTRQTLSNTVFTKNGFFFQLILNSLGLSKLFYCSRCNINLI